MHEGYNERALFLQFLPSECKTQGRKAIINLLHKDFIQSTNYIFTIFKLNKCIRNYYKTFNRF